MLQLSYVPAHQPVCVMMAPRCLPRTCSRHSPPPPTPPPPTHTTLPPPPPSSPLSSNQLSCVQVLGLTRRLSAKRTFLSNVMQQVEQHGEAHAKVGLLQMRCGFRG